MGQFSVPPSEWVSPGAPVSADLLALNFHSVLVELDGLTAVTEVHGLVAQVLAKGAPVVLCGAEADQAAVRQSLKAPLEGEGLLQTDIALHVPAPNAADKYRFKLLKICVLHRLPLPVRVCGAPLPLPMECQLCTNLHPLPFSHDSPHPFQSMRKCASMFTSLIPQHHPLIHW